MRRLELAFISLLVLRAPVEHILTLILPSVSSAGRTLHGALLALLALILLATGRRWRQIDLILLLFPLVVLSAFANAWLGYGRFSWQVFRWLVPLLCLLAGAYGLCEPLKVLALLKRWMLRLAPISLSLFFLGVILGDVHAVERGGILRYATGFSGPHSAAYYFGILTCLLWERLRAPTEGETRLPVWTWAGLAALLLAIYYTGTRTVMIFVGGFVFFREGIFLSRRDAIRRLTFPALLAVGYFVNSLTGRVNLSEFFSNVAKGSILNVGRDLLEIGGGRLLIWGTSLLEFSRLSLPEKMTGLGLGADTLLTFYRWGRPMGSHNDYLTVLLETGVLGLLGLLVWYFALWRRLRPSRAGKSRSAFGGGLLLAAVLANAFSNAFVVRPLASIYLWGIVGLILGCALSERRKHHAELDSR